MARTLKVNTGSDTAKLWVALTLLAGLVGASYTFFIGGTPHIGASVGVTIGGSLMGLEMFVVQRRYGEPLRRAPLSVYVGVMTVVWLLIIALSLSLCLLLLRLL